MPPPPRSPSSSTVGPLLDAQGANRAALTAQAIAIAAAAATAFTGWYATDQITDWSAALAKRVEAILNALAGSTDAYLARLTSDVAGKRVRPVGRVDVSTLRTGITHAGAYARAADVYRYQQSQFDAIARILADPNAPTPRPPDIVDPIVAAVNRVSAVADTDTNLTVQQQSQAFMVGNADQGKITGYRRVIHPELSKYGACGLCIAASDRVYGVQELMPLHDRCKCTPLAIHAHADPGSALNRADLDRLYADAGSTQREQLKNTRYQVNEHGELGPVLSREGAPFRTAAEVRAAQAAARPAKSAQDVARDVRAARDRLEQGLVKAKELAKADPVSWGPFLDQLETRVSGLTEQLAHM